MKINSFLPAVKNLPISSAKQQKDGKLQHTIFSMEMKKTPKTNTYEKKEKRKNVIYNKFSYNQYCEPKVIKQFEYHFKNFDHEVVVEL